MLIDRALDSKGMDSFGEWFRHLVKSAGYSGHTFSDRVGCSHTLVYSVMNDKAAIDPDDLYKWATALHLKGDDAEKFIATGRSIRSKRKSDSAEYVTELESKLSILLAQTAEMREKIDQSKALINRLAAFIAALLDFLATKNIHLPSNLSHSQQSLDSAISAFDRNRIQSDGLASKGDGVADPGRTRGN